MSDNVHRGPWKLQRHDNYMSDDDVAPLEIVDCDGEIIAFNTSYYPTELDAKYSHLIAAAPDLYQALERMKTWCEDEVGAELPCDSIDAALAKARGES